jgi:hypothetical protein
MKNQTYSVLTILCSAIVLGVMGYWLVPTKTKGAMTGIAVGAVVSAGYVHQNRRLEQLATKHHRLAAQQQTTDQTYQDGIHHLTTLFTQTESTLEGLARLITEHQANLDRLETTLEHRPTNHTVRAGQTNLNRQEINFIQKKLDELEARLNHPDAFLHHSIAVAEGTAPLLPYGAKSQVALEQPGRGEQEDLSQEDEEIAPEMMAWFNRKRVDIENYYQPDPIIDDFLDGLSLYLGENYSVLRTFHRRIRTSIGKRLRFDLRDYNSTECSIHHEFLRRLRDSALLSFGRYFKEKPDYIIAATHNRKDIQGFLNGGWFERFIYYKIVEIFDAKGIDYKFLRNPTIAYDNEDGSEIDIFFLVNDQPLLIECKSGKNYDEGIEKFVGHRSKLGLKSEEAIFVVLDIEESQALLRTRQWGITVVDQNTFIHYINQLADRNADNQFHGDLQEELAEDSNGELGNGDQETSRLSGFFKQYKLNLAPDYRSVVFQELVHLFEASSPLMSFNEITKTIRDRMAERSPLARSKVNEIINTLLASNYLRNQANRPERNVSRPIAKLHSSDPAVLERKAMEYYAKQIVQRFDPDFFEVDENIQEFERLTLGQAPTPDKIQAIKQR